MQRSNLIFLSIVLGFSIGVLAQEEVGDEAIKKAQGFLDKLESHKADWGSCEPLDKGKEIELCDGTKVNKEELSSLFKKTASELVSFIKSKNIKLEILCKISSKPTFQNWCKSNVNRNFFKEVTSLHGQYIPKENAIVLHSDALLGSLVHEYVHYLQFQNKNKKYDVVYKSERIAIQNEIVESLDGIIAKVQSLEKSGAREQAQRYLPSAMKMTDLMMKLGFWQNLIDERNIFLLHVRFNKELGIPKDDVDLAQKNLGFLCKNKNISSFMNPKDCGVAN